MLRSMSEWNREKGIAVLVFVYWPPLSQYSTVGEGFVIGCRTVLLWLLLIFFVLAEVGDGA